MSGDELTIEQLTDEADRLEERGDLEGAFRYWQRAVDCNADAITLCRLGSVAMDLGDFAAAERAFLQASEQAPNLPNAHNLLGLLYFERGDLKSAHDRFLWSAKLQESERTLTLLGSVQIQLGMLRMARESLTAALKVDPNYEEAHCNLGLAYKEELPTEAVSCFRKAVEIDPLYALAHRELGWTLRRLGRQEEAQNHLRKAIELDPSDGWAHIYLANLVLSTGDSRSAEEALVTATQVWDNRVPLWSLALFYEHQGRSKEADFLSRRAGKGYPDDPEDNLRFGLFLKELGENENARVHLERVLSANPVNEAASDALADLK